jgi:hypothetical protein
MRKNQKRRRKKRKKKKSQIDAQLERLKSFEIGFSNFPSHDSDTLFHNGIV